MNELCTTELKATRLQMAHPLTPQQLAEADMVLTRSAINSFFMDTHANDEDTPQVEGEEINEEQNQDSLKDDKRQNPKVGRAIGPKRKSVS